MSLMDILEISLYQIEIKNSYKMDYQLLESDLCGTTKKSIHF